jgi:SAM-dependent methyltransferase
MENDFWEANAEQWAKVIDARAIASRAVTNPAILNATLDCKPRSVLDLGCGEGWMAPEFQSRQISYLGLDGSAKLVEIAQKKYGPHFEHRSYDDLIGSKTSAKDKGAIAPVDAVVLNYSLLDEKLLPTFQAIKNLVNSGGSIVIQTLHPCFVLKPYQDGWRDEDFKALPAAGAEPLKFQGTMPWYGRTLSSWLKLFSDAGLRLDKTIEPLGADGPVSIIFILK